MLRRFFPFILFTLLAAVCAGLYNVKMLVKLSPGFGQYRLKIIPIAFDSAVSDSSIMNCLDTLPALLFGAATYNLMYKDDSTRLAIMINEHGIFRKKFYITEYWKNGNIKREATYKRHSKHYSCSIFYSNEILAAQGNYQNNRKIGRWLYINTAKKKIRVEIYAKDGSLKKTITFKPPQSTLATFFEVVKPQGSPYIVR